MNYLKRSLELKDEIIATRRHIHQFPELGSEQINTSEFVKNKLKEFGLSPINVGGYGVSATIGKGSPVLLLRADMDALPMTEQSGLNFASKIDGVAHCCGHDTHTAMLLYAAKMLKENEDNLKGTVKLMFQPAEEIGDGCQSMVDDGILQNPSVDYAMAMHVDAGSPLGMVSYSENAAFCSNDVFEVKVTGKDGHGARPHQCIDSINAAAHIVIALETLIARESDPSETNILTVCSIESSTKIFNIMPAFTTIMGSIRTYNESQRQMLLRRFKEVCEYTAKSFGCSVEIDISQSMPTLCVDNRMENKMLSYIKKELGDEVTINEKPIKKMGSEDFCCVTNLVPSAFFFMGAGIDRVTPYHCSQHNAGVVFNEDMLHLGSSIFCYCAASWLEDNQKLNDY